MDGSLRRPARIRHLARDGVLVASFSLATSISATLLLGLLTWWLR